VAILITIASVFQRRDYGFTFSYARKLPVPGFQYGVNAKVIRRIIGNLQLLGFGFDGVQFWKTIGNLIDAIIQPIMEYRRGGIRKSQMPYLENSRITRVLRQPKSNKLNQAKFIIRYDYISLLLPYMVC
jgi:hypothetical protein